MAKDLNMWQGIARLGRDPEIRYSPSGAAVANLNLACGESWKDKNTGEKQERTEWVRVVAFNKLAEIIGEYLSKGSQVYISGKLTTRKWQDKEGNDRYTTEVVADQMQMLGSRGGASDSVGDSPSRSQGADSVQSSPQGANEFDQDIPFMDPYKHIRLMV